MKNLFIASAALLASASVAFAEIKFSGFARFGLGYVEDRDQQDGVDPQTSDTILISRFRLNIDGDAETDGGVRFSARVRLQADEDDDTGEAEQAGLNGARFSVIYNGLRVDAGNVAGSFDNSDGYFGVEAGLEDFLNQYSGVNYEFLEFSSTGTGANAVFFQYATGNFAFTASYDQNTENNGSGTAGLSGADQWDLGVTYVFDNITASLIYGETDGAAGQDDSSLTVLTLTADLGDFSGTLFLADDDVNDEAEDGTAYGLSAAYNLGAATTLQFVYGDGNAEGDERHIGVGAVYDLGNGISLRGGVGEIKPGDDDSFVQADFGARFNF